MANAIEYKPVVDIIMPTFDNRRMLNISVTSLFRNTSLPYRLFVVNNHTQPVAFDFSFADKILTDVGFIHVLQQDENRGWMGGINTAIETIRKDYGGLSKYVMYLNDDVRILDEHQDWLTNMVSILEKYHDVGAVGPASNAVMYYQSLEYIASRYHEIPIISGFCLLTRSDIINEIGGPDENLKGGDDIDYSIRIRDAGYRLVCCRRSYVHHYYAQTGKRLHPEWDSKEWEDEVNQGLINKHGFKKFITMAKMPLNSIWDVHKEYDIEKTFLKDLLEYKEGDVVIDMGCGVKKIHENAIGVDLIANGEFTVSNRAHPNTQVDVVADISKPLPFEDGFADVVVGSHVIEHIYNYLETLKEWKRVLKVGGKMILVVPDPELYNAIACDPSHVHAFTKEALETSFEMLGMKVVGTWGVEGAFSIIIKAEKTGEDK